MSETPVTNGIAADGAMRQWCEKCATWSWQLDLSRDERGREIVIHDEYGEEEKHKGEG